MSVDPIWVVETADGAAIGYATPIANLTVTYARASADISAVNTSSLTLSDGRTVNAGQHPGAWPRVLRSNLNSIRGTNWPDAAGDVSVQGTDVSAFGPQTISKAVVLNSDGTTSVIS